MLGYYILFRYSAYDLVPLHDYLFCFDNLKHVNTNSTFELQIKVVSDFGYYDLFYRCYLRTIPKLTVVPRLNKNKIRFLNDSIIVGKLLELYNFGCEVGVRLFFIPKKYIPT